MFPEFYDALGVSMPIGQLSRRPRSCKISRTSRPVRDLSRYPSAPPSLSLKTSSEEQPKSSSRPEYAHLPPLTAPAHAHKPRPRTPLPLPDRRWSPAFNYSLQQCVILSEDLPWLSRASRTSHRGLRARSVRSCAATPHAPLPPLDECRLSAILDEALRSCQDSRSSGSASLPPARS